MLFIVSVPRKLLSRRRWTYKLLDTDNIYCTLFYSSKNFDNLFWNFRKFSSIAVRYDWFNKFQWKFTLNSDFEGEMRPFFCFYLRSHRIHEWTDQVNMSYVTKDNFARVQSFIQRTTLVQYSCLYFWFGFVVAFGWLLRRKRSSQPLVISLTPILWGQVRLVRRVAHTEECKCGVVVLV